MSQHDKPIAYLVLRKSPDCSPKMVEIMGVTQTYVGACDLRDYVYKHFRQACEIEKVFPEDAVPVQTSDKEN